MELLNKYAWLVDTIHKAGRITFIEINDLWQDEMGGGELPKRTFNNWKYAAEEMFGLNIYCDRRTNEYYINSDVVKDRKDLRKWLLQTAILSNRLSDSMKLSTRILVEEVPSAQQFLTEVLEAMKKSRRLTITYQSYGRPKPFTFPIEPYCLKCFRQRWYILAHSPEYEKILVYSLDRIQDLQTEEKTFKLPKGFDAAGFFADYFGVIPQTDVEMTEVVLRISDYQAPYLRSLPLHHSQKEEVQADGSSLFTYHLRPTLDFQQALLALGPSAEVLQPESLREEIKGEIEEMLAMYK